MSQATLCRVSSNYVNWDQYDAIFYVAKGGSDTNDGRNIEAPKLTFGSAVSAANALTPSATNQFAIVCLDAGTYNETITLVKYVSVYAPNAYLVGSIVSADFSYAKFNKQYVSSSASSGVFYGGTDYSYVDIDTIECESNANWAYQSIGWGTLNATFKDITLVDGYAVYQYSGAGSIVVHGGTIHISGTGIGVYSSSGKISGVIDSIYDTGLGNSIGIKTSTGAASYISLSMDRIQDADTALSIVGGEADVFLRKSLCPTLYDVGSGALLRLVINDTGGAVDKINNGLVYLNVPIATVVATAAVDPIRIQTNYITDNIAGITYTLPSDGNFGDRFRIIGKTGIWTIAQRTNQTIYIGNQSTTTGVGGSLVATDSGDCVELECITEGASTDWRVVSSMGNITVN